MNCFNGAPVSRRGGVAQSSVASGAGLPGFNGAPVSRRGGALGLVAPLVLGFVASMGPPSLDGGELNGFHSWPLLHRCFNGAPVSRRGGVQAVVTLFMQPLASMGPPSLDGGE